MPEPSPLDHEAEEAHRLALRHAEGRGVPQSWNEALAHLEKAAELGSPLARSTLTALTGDGLGAANDAGGIATSSGDMRNRWRDRIDIDALLAVPRPKILSAAPRIAIVEEFASAPTCDWIVSRARPRLKAARVYDHASAAPLEAQVRTNSECHFLGDDSDLILAILRVRMARLAGLPVDGMEAAAILHYTVGQQFEPHFDFFDPAIPGYAKEVAEGGQRVLTFLICLNDGYEGGETHFPVLGKSFKGRKGTALFFWNVTPEGVPDPRTRHAGLPPSSGEKWLLSQWIRARPPR